MTRGAIRNTHAHLLQRADEVCRDVMVAGHCHMLAIDMHVTAAVCSNCASVLFLFLFSVL